MGGGRPTCNTVLTSGSVGMGIQVGNPMGIPVGMGWGWGLKCHPHGSPGTVSCATVRTEGGSDKTWQRLFQTRALATK